jgi:hypothetical protein
MDKIYPSQLVEIGGGLQSENHRSEGKKSNKDVTSEGDGEMLSGGVTTNGVIIS